MTTHNNFSSIDNFTTFEANTAFFTCLKRALIRSSPLLNSTRVSHFPSLLHAAKPRWSMGHSDKIWEGGGEATFVKYGIIRSKFIALVAADLNGRCPLVSGCRS